MLKPLLLSALLVALLPMAQAELPDEPHIVVDGVGSVESVPDIAVLHFSVEVTDKTLAAAKQSVDRQLGKAIASAKALGIADDDISASRIQAQPQYEWRDKERHYVGERVSRQVALTLNNTDNYNTVVDALLAAGVSRLNPAQLEHSAIEQLERDALNKALDNARNKASSMAQHLGVKLDGVYQIAPANDRAIVHGMEMRASVMKDAAESAPLKVAKQTIEQRVRVVFLIDN
jgi:hypothetical protein